MRSATHKRLSPRPAVEAGAFTLLIEKAVPLAQWATHRAGRTLFVMPVIKTAYIAFGVTLGALAWVKIRGESWSEYGLKPIRTAGPLVRATAILVAAVFAYSILLEPTVDAIVLQVFGGEPTQAAGFFKVVVGNVKLFSFVLPFIWIFGAFGEEFFYRGFLMTKIARALGGGRKAWYAAVFLQAVVFGLGHRYQGAVGMIGTGITGLIYGAGTLLARGTLWPAVIVHGAIDTIGFTLLYLGRIPTG